MGHSKEVCPDKLPIPEAILEKVNKEDKNYRLEREKFYIKKFDTHNNGLN